MTNRDQEDVFYTLIGHSSASRQCFYDLIGSIEKHLQRLPGFTSEQSELMHKAFGIINEVINSSARPIYSAMKNKEGGQS